MFEFLGILCCDIIVIEIDLNNNEYSSVLYNFCIPKNCTFWNKIRCYIVDITFIWHMMFCLLTYNDWMHVNLIFQSNLSNILMIILMMQTSPPTPTPKKNFNFTVELKWVSHNHNILDHLKINNHSITCIYSFTSLLINSSKMNNIFNYVYKDINSHSSIWDCLHKLLIKYWTTYHFLCIFFI